MRNELKTLIAASVVFACGDSGGRDDAGGSATLTPTSSATATMTATATETASASETAGPTSEAPTMGTGSESNGTTDPTDGVTSTPTTTNGGPKFDLGVTPDGGMACSGGGGEPDFSYIWVANSGQGTMSKINTVNLVEEGRYIVRPDSAGSPSRTSVNLSGDVVIANRNGGLTKVYARSERCADTNGMPGIQTAADANYLPWGVEECVAWYTPMSYISQRPVAWTQGNFNKATCQWENQKIWTSGNNDDFVNADNQLDVLLLNGDTGAIEATVNVVGVNPDYYGIYGAAVDGDGNFWGSQLGIGQLVFIDRLTLQYKLWPMPLSGYGMTVDSKGFAWTCGSGGAARFDPMTETWQTLVVPGSGGCMEDGNGTLYMSGSGPTILAIDTMTMTQKDTLNIPSYVHGISIDFYGYVWGVTLQEPYAYRVDPLTKVVDTFTGLTAPYTYSDMTGFALSNAGSPSG